MAELISFVSYKEYPRKDIPYAADPTIKGKLDFTNAMQAAMQRSEHVLGHRHGFKYRSHSYLEEYEALRRQKKITVKITKTYSIELSLKLIDLSQEIENSKYILKLKENWDDNGTQGYKEATFIQTIEFLVKYAEWILKEKAIIIDVPFIQPSTDGGIDLYWKKDKYDLLVSIPAHPNRIAKFYGDDKGDIKINGEFPINLDNQGIFLCLLNLK